MKKNLLFLMCCIFVPLQSMAVTWSAHQDISDNNSEASLVVVDSSGDALAAWMNFDGSNVVIQSSNYTGTWSTPVTVSPEGFDANFHDISMSPTGGNGLMVWQVFNGTNFVIQAAAFSSGSWGTPETISSSDANAYESKVTINSSGDGFAIWSESTSSNDVIMVAEYSGGSWGTPQVLSSSLLQSMSPTVAISDAGTAIAAWLSYNLLLNEFEVFASSTSTLGWSVPQLLSTPGATCFFPKVVINSTGVGFAVWNRVNDSLLALDSIVAVRFNGLLWGLNTIISDPDFNASLPDIAINNSGNACAVWQNSNESITVGNNMFLGGSWGTPQEISSSPNSAVKVGIDNLDNAVAVWSVDSSGTSIVQSAESVLSSWGSAGTLSDTSQYAISPKIGVNSLGEAVVTWDGSDGINFLIQSVTGTP